MRMQRLEEQTRSVGILLSAALAGSACLLGSSAYAQNEDWEWEYDEGYHQEEWYDPSDWLDNDNRVDYERDWYEYDPNVRHDQWEWESDEGYHQEEWYDPSDWFGYDYGVNYERDWYEGDGTWDYDYGYASDSYDRDYVYDDWRDYGYGTGLNGRDYGIHYVWDADRNEWISDYGWYEDKYNYVTEQYYNSGEYRQEEQRDSSQRRSQQDQRTHVYTGTIDKTKRIHVHGFEKDHLLVKLDTRDGKTVTVNLGPGAQLSDFNVSQGDQVRVRGHMGTLDDRRMLMASQVASQDMTRARQPQQQRQQQQAQRDRMAQQRQSETRRTFSGTVDDYRKMSIDGRPAHTYVKVELENGETRIVDLGPRLTVNDIDLSKGDRLSVEGVQRTIDGKTVFVARRINVEGSTHTVSRAAMEGDRRDRRDRQGEAVVRGAIEDYREVDVGRPDPHTVIKLRLEDGDAAIVDLGSRVSMSQLNNYNVRDHNVVIRGQWKQVNGRSVLVADQVSIAGQTFQLSAAQSR